MGRKVKAICQGYHYPETRQRLRSSHGVAALLLFLVGAAMPIGYGLSLFLP